MSVMKYPSNVYCIIYFTFHMSNIDSLVLLYTLLYNNNLLMH